MNRNEPLSLSRRVKLGLCSVGIVLAIWIVLTTAWPGLAKPLVRPLKLPGLGLVWGAVISTSGNLVIGFLTTYLRVIIGLILGGGLGVVTALYMAHRPVVRALLDPLIEALRPVPPFALAPFVILWLGIGFTGQLSVVTLASFMVMVVSTTGAIAQVERKYVDFANTLGADAMTAVFSVILPSIVPALVGATRVAAATAVGIAAAAEYLGAERGLGLIIRDARTTLQTESVLLAGVCLGLGSWVLDALIRRLGAALTRWQERTFSF